MTSPNLEEGLIRCHIVLKKHIAQGLIRAKALETFPNFFFSMLIYASESIIPPVCVTTWRIIPSKSKGTAIVTFTDAEDHQRDALLVLPRTSIFLPGELHCSYPLQHYHKHC